MNRIPEIHEVEIMSLKLEYIRFLKIMRTQLK